MYCEVNKHDRCSLHRPLVWHKFWNESAAFVDVGGDFQKIHKGGKIDP